MKKSVIKQSEWKRSFNGKEGSEMHVVILTLQNGDTGETFAQSKDQYREGQELNYELNFNSKYNRNDIKVIKEKTLCAFMRKSTRPSSSTYIGIAKDLIISTWEKKEMKREDMLTLKDMVTLAKHLAQLGDEMDRERGVI